MSLLDKIDYWIRGCREGDGEEDEARRGLRDAIHQNRNLLMVSSVVARKSIETSERALQTADNAMRIIRESRQDQS